MLLVSKWAMPGDCPWRRLSVSHEESGEFKRSSTKIHPNPHEMLKYRKERNFPSDPQTSQMEVCIAEGLKGISQWENRTEVTKSDHELRTPNHYKPDKRTNPLLKY